ncbi:MAG: hypothetical protein JNM56_02505 [Planctomycetia bacterium]|nr:hypothetical protein [Planctomycetia bacterium]
MVSAKQSLLCLTLGLSALLRASAPFETRWDAIAAGTAPADPLAQLNDYSRAVYAQARKTALEKSGPIVLLEGDSLVLLRQGKRTEVKAVPELYHQLKTVAHIPLALFAFTIGQGEGDLGEQRAGELKKYRTLIENAAKDLPKRGLPAAVLARQNKIIDPSLAFIDGLLESKKVRRDEALKYIQGVKPAVLENMYDAAKSELDGLHKQMTAWKAELTPEEWKSLKVVIQGSALPRKGNLAVQYFARLLGEPGEGFRIVYTESVYDEERSLRSLATSELDRGVAIAFFDEPTRMHRDLLADVATEYIQKMKFEP